MMSRYIHRIHKLSALMGDLIVSAAGCFALMRGFRLVASGQERQNMASSMRAGGRSTKQFAGIGAALFLLAFIASEALATIGALRR
jgi:hypothetical protein